MSSNDPQVPPPSQPLPPPGYQPPPSVYAPGPGGDPYVKRPWNVTLVAVLALIVGILDVLAGVGLLLFRNEINYQNNFGLNASNLAFYGAVVLVLGAITLLVAFGLFGGSRLARGTIAFLSVVKIALGVVGILLGNVAGVWGGYAGSIAIAVIVLCLLYAGERTRRFFHQ